MGININEAAEAAPYHGTKFVKKDVRNATEVDVFVGKQLKALRKNAGMSQTNLAEQVGVTFQQIQKYERGTNRIGASRLWAFCQVFSVNPNQFFQGLDTDLG
jgi:DNA-binding transcriptional regulator YiaG